MPRHSVSTPAARETGAREPGAWAFAILYAIESFSRASLVSIVPIQAYDLLESKQGVSILFFAVGVFGVVATICAPILFQHFRRRTVYVLGALALVAASACFAVYTLPGQAAGMFLRIFGAGALNIALSLYIMEFIPRHGFVRSESLRLALATLAWTFGPWFGVWLYVRYGHIAPYLWSAAWAVILIGAFFLFRLSGKRRPVAIKAATPIASVRRFLKQPRMRLAWLIAFGRSCYWGTFYVYAPILMVSTGEGKLAGGLVVSIGNALLAFAIGWGRLGGRLGVRRVVVLSFVSAAILAVLAGVAGERHPWMAAILLLAGVNFAVALDAVGGAPFLRSVHPYERPQMTAVYRTNLDLSDLLPALIYSVILGFAGLGAVFVTLGLFCSYCAYVAWRHLPRSM